MHHSKYDYPNWYETPGYEILRIWNLVALASNKSDIAVR